MKLKRYSLSVLVLGLFIAISGFIIPLLCWENYTSQNGAEGVADGIDAVTYRFMLSNLFDGLPFVLVMLGISLMVVSGFCLIFSKTVKAHCNIKTSAISVGLSGVGSLGLICSFLWLVIVSLGETSRYPIRYPVSILLATFCFLSFIVLNVLYFTERKKNWSIKGIIIDVLTGILYLPTFFFFFSYLHEILTGF